MLEPRQQKFVTAADVTLSLGDEALEGETLEDAGVQHKVIAIKMSKR